MKKDNSETNRNMQGLSDFIDDFRAKHESNVKEVSGIRTAMSKAVNDFEDMSHELKQEIKVSINEVKEENYELKDTIIDLQCRSMKNNLIFTGLREPENENTENMIRGFIKDELHIYHKLELGNVHRFGTGAQPGKRGRPRPIVARFIYHNDLAMVMSNTYRLKGKQYGVNKQFPEAIEQARKSLYPIMKEMKAEGHRVRLVRDILYVDGVIYNHQTLNSPSPNNRREVLNTPEDYQSQNSVYKVPDAFNELEQEFLKFSVEYKYILLNGDFNSRTSRDVEYIETVHSQHDIVDTDNVDILNNLELYDMSKVRCSMDTSKNAYGNMLLEMCKNNNIIILNGRVNGDKEGKFTCRQASVVDYFICTYDFLCFVVNMYVQDFSKLFSDVHSPLILSLNFKDGIEEDVHIAENSVENAREVKRVQKWDVEKKNEFVEFIDKDKISDLVAELESVDSNLLSQGKINEVVENINSIFLDAAENVLGTYNASQGSRTGQKWAKRGTNHGLISNVGIRERFTGEQREIITVIDQKLKGKK
ncbi:unnamed protein product [Mytilus edulis]|uniref:Endonuclease/exonuclease/phosphatase domain-containing protein n=1 Tax=Mytilus edulis TaxID=6550 RepID=A0A8S3VB46_MYTED|nr:unnamed protein product [Mytilus edulis]